MSERRWRGASLRLRMVALAAAAVTGVLLLGGLLLAVGLREILVSNAVGAARLRARDLSVLAAQDSLPHPIAIAGNDEALVQVVGAARQGAARQVLASSANIEEEPALGLPTIAPGREEVFRVDRLPIDAEDFRVVARGARTPEGPATVYVAVPLEDVHETVGAAVTLGLTGLPLFVLALATVMWVLVGRTLRPVEAIRREVDEIGERDLARRVPEPPRRDEIGRLARTMNAMLDRLERSAQRQRRFVGDAAHELRSPIASLRAQLETAREARRPVDWRQVSGELLDETLRVQRLTEQLLLLAHTDDGPGARRGPVDLDDLVDQVVARAREQAPADLVIDTSGVEPAQVRGDALQLEQVVRNLVDNARRHARGRVALTLEGHGSAAVLVVDDDGPGIPESRREEVFRRFTRLDDARDRDDGGAGLGLAIVRDVVVAHGGEVTVSTAPAGGARFSIRLPRI